MRLGKVIGEVWGARQAPRLAGHKLLVVRPLRLAKAGREGPTDWARHRGTVGPAGRAAQSDRLAKAGREGPTGWAQRDGKVGPAGRAAQSDRLLGGHTPADDLPSGTQLSDDSATVVAIDTLGAGVGELVLVAHGTRSRDLTYGADVPTKDVVIAIVDGVDVDLASAARARR